MTEPLVNPAGPREQQPITLLVLARTLAVHLTAGVISLQGRVTFMSSLPQIIIYVLSRHAPLPLQLSIQAASSFCTFLMTR